MDEIDELKDALGAAAGGYNDAQLERLSREIDLMAEFLLDLYMVRHSKKAEQNFAVLTPKPPFRSMR